MGQVQTGPHNSHIKEIVLVHYLPVVHFFLVAGRYCTRRRTFSVEINCSFQMKSGSICKSFNSLAAGNIFDIFE
jgi:hypothetical protein